jgi:hypothetical protein
MEDLPQIYASPRRRTGSFVGTSSYTRRHKRRGPSLGTLLFYWLTSAAAGITIGYLILFYGLGRDPAKIGENLPSVNVEWPKDAAAASRPNARRD